MRECFFSFPPFYFLPRSSLVLPMESAALFPRLVDTNTVSAHLFALSFAHELPNWAFLLYLSHIPGFLSFILLSFLLSHWERVECTPCHKSVATKSVASVRKILDITYTCVTAYRWLGWWNQDFGSLYVGMGRCGSRDSKSGLGNVSSGSQNR